MSVGCDQDQGIDDDVKPCELGPEELEHNVALRRQYDYFGIDDLCKIPSFSLVLYEERDCDPREALQRGAQQALIPARVPEMQIGLVPCAAK